MVLSADRGRAHAEAARMVDNIPVQGALVDGNGRIIAVNAFWREFAESNGYPDTNYGLGNNYVETCRSAKGDFSAEARLVAQELHEVLKGDRDEFSIVYPCHSPTERRWFRLLASATRDEPGAVILHFNITPQMLAEERQAASRIEAERKLARFEEALEASSRKTLNSLQGMSQPQAAREPSNADLLPAYREMIEASLGPTGNPVDDIVRDMARRIAISLAERRSDATDVSRLHADALEATVRSATRDRAMWLVHESRLVLIGVVGYLADQYLEQIETA